MIIKSLSKGVPAIIMVFFSMNLWSWYQSMLPRHGQDHLPKHRFKSNKFERLIRIRDDKIRLYYKPMIDYQPVKDDMKNFKEF